MKNVCVFIALIMMCSCQQNSIFNGKVIEVSDVTITECKGNMIFEGLGMDIVVCTPNYLVVQVYNSDYFLEILDKKTYQSLGKLCPRGKAANEFISINILNQYYNSDSILITDYGKKGYIYELDINKSLDQKKTHISNIYEYDKGEGELLQAFYSDGNFTTKEFVNDENKMVYKLDSKTIFDIFSIHIDNNFLNKIPILGDRYEPSLNKIVVYTAGDQIDIIDLNRPNNSISIIEDGKFCWNSSDYLEKNKDSHYSGRSQSNNSFILSTYKNGDKYEFHLTNWDGDYIKKIQIKESLISIGVDWDSYRVYGVTKDDLIVEYDIANIIAGIIDAR